MNVGVIERRLIDELDDDTDESIEGSPRRISAPEIETEMNNRLANHLRVSAERNGVDLGPRKDLAASLAVFGKGFCASSLELCKEWQCLEPRSL